MNAPETATAATPSTTDLFIPVPETTLPDGTIVPAFRVGQYVCTQGADGRAAVTAEGTPWVRINFEEAKAACLAAGYALITERQWLAIAHQVAQLPINWNSGVVGKGRLAQGLRQDSVDGPQPGDYLPDDPDEQRFLTLSNGELICDLNGNVYQWVFDDAQGDAAGLVGKVFAEDSPSLTTAPFPSGTNGMGWRPSAGSNWSGCALVRGGAWFSEAGAGAFRLDSGWPGYRGDVVGFRCTQPGL
jgi:formylglycine-generating enzyme required for sulfatase activity